MSDPANITEFKLQPSQVVAKLHAAFSARQAVETSEISEDGIRWTMNSGVVSGDFHEYLQGFSLHNAQLTGAAMSILQKSESNVGGQILGATAVKKITIRRTRAPDRLRPFGLAAPRYLTLATPVWSASNACRCVPWSAASSYS